jgi:hypothetical protein
MHTYEISGSSNSGPGEEEEMVQDLLGQYADPSALPDSTGYSAEDYQIEQQPMAEGGAPKVSGLGAEE